MIELVGAGVTREEAVACVAQAYRRFYFRPRIVWKRFRNLGSFRELRRLAGGAAGILLNVGGKK